MSTDDELFTPDEVLGGFSAKRTRLLLFQIESRTAFKTVGAMVTSRQLVPNVSRVQREMLADDGESDSV
jgi:hypothetical protein